MVEDKAK